MTAAIETKGGRVPASGARMIDSVTMTVSPCVHEMSDGDGVALRTDGLLVRIRPVRTDDRDGLHRLNQESSDDSVRFRFFTMNREMADRYADRLTADPPEARRTSLVALIDGRIVGLACLELVDNGSDNPIEQPLTAEIAVQVSDHEQHEGIGTLLVEQLISAARRRHVRRIVADVLADNGAMMRVLRGLGLSMHAETCSGVTAVRIDLDDVGPYADAMTDREQRAEALSLRPLRSPRSVAVIGVGAGERSVGRVLVTNLVRGGYRGELFIVSPHARRVRGAHTVTSVAKLPVAPELVVVAVPAAQVAAVVEDCGRRGARVMVLLTAGFGELGVAGVAAERAVVETVQRYGMRLVGPNCLGIVNTAPDVRLDATFAPMPMLPGGLALASQSGAVGIAVIGAAARRGLGIAEFVSMGNKADVSGNDLLLAWQDDDRISVIGLYLESVGNPRRFARIARTVARTKPVLALKSGRSAAGQQAGRSHTAAAAAAEPVVDALFEQAGVQRIDTMEQLLDAVRVIDHQPPPAGPRLAIIGNSGGPGIVAADAAEAAGLVVVPLSEQTRAQLRAVAPDLASDQNPIDLSAAVPPAQVRAAVTTLLKSGEIDSIVTVFAETLAAAPEQIRAAVTDAADGATLPVVAVEVGAVPTGVELQRGGQLPVFAFPEPAVGALACATRAAAVRRADRPTALRADDADLHRARTIVASHLARAGAGWLAPDEAAAVLDALGVRGIDQRLATSAAEAVAIAHELDAPIVLKITGDVHKSDIGGVRVDLRTPREVRAAARDLLHIRPGQPLLVQPLHRGIELIVGAIQDPSFGPVVLVGAGGVLTDLLGARSLRPAPLSGADAEAMLAEGHLSMLLDGFRGAPPVSRAAVTDLLARISRLVDEVRQVAELDLNPVICTGDDLVIVDAKIRVAAALPGSDPLSRLAPVVAPVTPSLPGES